MNKFDEYFMSVAEEASKLSSATRLRVGCVLVRDKRVLATGYNGTPSGYYTNICEDETGTTKDVVIHAELNALLQMAMSTESSKNSTAYTTHAPCINCAKSLAQAGIKKLIYKEEYTNGNGLNTLRDLGVEVIKYG